MIGSTLYVMGRLSSSTSGVSNYTALKAYSFSGSSWSTKASMSTGRAHFGAAVYDSKIYVFGGNSFFMRKQNFIEIYDPKTNKWKFGENLGSFVEVGTEIIKNEVYIIGGSTTKGITKYE